MEVLISMFVLAVGLLGVAALIPAGRHEIVEATKLETAAMVGSNAFRDIQTRGYMNPANWRDDSVSGNTGTFKYRPDAARTDGTQVPFAYQNPISTNQDDYDDPAVFSRQLCAVIDPLGLTAPAGPYLNTFPNGFAGTQPLALRRIVPFQPSSNAFACFDNIFRSSVDLITTPNPTNKDLPPNQQFTPPAGTPLRRASNGNYSWMATIVSDPSRPTNSGDVNVAVVVFYKRDLSSEGAGEYPLKAPALPINVAFPVTPMTSGGEAVITLPTGVKPLKPGQWIMLAGYNTVQEQIKPQPALKTDVDLYYYHWYRVLSAANPVGTNQNVTLAGQDWPSTVANTQAWIFDNIVSVYEKSLPLELE